MYRWISIFMMLVLSGSVWIVDFGSGGVARAAVNDPIYCAGLLSFYNTDNDTLPSSIRIFEAATNNGCGTLAGGAVSCAFAATSNRLALCNEVAGGSLKLRHEGTRFANFKIDGGADLAPDTNHVIDATGGAHTITYTDTTDGENRTFNITVNANGQDIDAMSTITTVDVTAPTIAITGVPAETDGTTAFTATFTFDEDITGFDLADINAALTNGAATAFATTTANRVFTALITPSGAGDTIVGVNANAAIDGATNGNVAAPNQTATLDNTAPTIAITGVPAVTDGTTAFTATFTFDEDITGFDLADINAALINGTATVFATTTANRVFTALITPNGAGDAIVGVNANAAIDGATNGNVVAPNQTATLDATAPTIAITGVPAVTDGTTAFTATFTFNEDVTGFDLADINAALTNGTATVFATTTANRVFTALITPNGAGDTIVGVNANAAIDGATNGNTAATDQTAILNSDKPTVAITDVPAATDGATAFTATFTFNEDVTGFDLSDINAALTNGTATAFATTTAKRVYTALITPSGAGDTVVGVKADAAIDVATNGNIAAIDQTAILNSDKPTVAITGVPAVTDGATAFTATFTFNEDVTGFDLSDINAALTNGTATAFATTTAKRVFTALITPNGAGDTVVGVNANAAIDTANNGNTVAAKQTAVLDNSDPAIAITGVPAETDGATAFTATFTFDEDVTGFDLADINAALTNGTATVFATTTANRVFTALITPNRGGDTIVGINANVAMDAASNGNTAATDQTAVLILGPTVEETQKVIAEFMLNRANHILGNQPSLISFVDGSNTKGGGPLGVLGLNANKEGMTLAFSTSRSKILASRHSSRIKTSHSVAEQAEQRIERAFAFNEDGSARGAELALLSNNLDDTKKAQEGDDQAYQSLGRAGTWDVWTEIYGSRTNAGSSDSSLWVGYLGFHTFLTDHMMVGVLGQLDWADETNAAVNSNAEGSGWMIGPYIAGKIPDQNIYYEARASWGRSHNRVSPNSTYIDSFDTTRWLASAKIAGSHVIEDLTIRPEVSVSWFEETQESYTDSIAQFIPEQTISLGEIRFGPTLTRSIALGDDAFVRPSFGISGVWNFGIKENAATQGFALGNDALRARLDVGLATTNARGWTLALAGYYDGIGINDYDSYGGSVALIIPLN